MTVANGTVCMHPLANPFNTRLGWSNYTLNPLGKGNPFFRKAIDRSCTTLPQPRPYGSECIPLNNPFAQYVDYNEMHLPDTTIPNMRVQAMNKHLFTAPDGTVIDVDKRKVLSSPNKPIKDANGVEYWGDQTESQMTKEVIGSMSNSLYQSGIPNNLESSGNIQKIGDDYFKDSNKKNARLYAVMSQEQKDLLMQVPRMFPSRLIEVADED